MRFSRVTSVLIAVLVVLGLTSFAPAVAGDPGAPANVVAPTLTGTARVGAILRVEPGTWTPSAASYRFTWRRDGALVVTTTTPERTLTLADRNHRLTVAVTALNEAGASDPVSTAPSPVVRSGVFAPGSKVRVTGVRRWDHRLTADPGTTVPAAASLAFRWLRDGKPIPGAVRRSYFLTAADFGHRVEARATSRRPGFFALTRSSGRTAAIGHRVPVRRTFTYSIATRGAITADVGVFARQAAQTFADPRGWRAAGFAFRRVAGGGDFRLFLAAANTLPGFGYPCDSTWSCRVGNNVIINQTRWLHASPAWNAAGLPLRDYRHMVVNHETGHWLGHRHASCSGPGRPAPVMMQQSKGRAGCRFNPFPLPGERWTSR